MPLTSDKHNVAIACGIKCSTNGRSAIFDDGNALEGSAFNTAENVSDNGCRLLRSWIVAGYDHCVGKLCRDAPHFGSLAAITIATTTKHDMNARVALT